MCDFTKPDAKCPDGFAFYTCETTSPQFCGCCIADFNPCHNDGFCSKTTTTLASPASTTSRASTFTSTRRPTSTRDPSEWFATPVSSATNLPEDESPQSNNTAAIIGGSVGGAVFLLILGALWYLFLRRPSRTSGEQSAPLQADGKYEDTTYHGPTGGMEMSMYSNEGYGIGGLKQPARESDYVELGGESPYSSMGQRPLASPIVEGFVELPAAGMDPVELAGDGQLSSPLLLRPNLRWERDAIYGENRTGGAHERYSADEARGLPP